MSTRSHPTPLNLETKASGLVTLPPKNLSLAEWFNYGKETGNDTRHEGAIHA